MNQPTAPFVETAGLAFLHEFTAQRPALAARRDGFGNLLVRYRRGPVKRGFRPILFAAHLDHPGFVAERMEDGRTLRAAWRGWVRPEYFKGARVRFRQDGGWVRGRIVSIVSARGGGRTRRAKPTARTSARSFGAESPPRAALVRVAESVRPGAPGMWDFPDAAVSRHLLKARACDDVAGVGAILCMLDSLCRKRVRGACYALFTRAEEVGFAGALAACANGFVPRRCVVVAIECSKAITGVAMGGGPVLRVGDKATVFTPAATAFCQSVAEDLAVRDSGFRYQRKLMDGGTCESTVYCHYGYDATGICLPLLNYHNMDTERRRIAPEMIDLRDLENLIKWFEALVRTRRRFDGTHPGLDARLAALWKRHRPVLSRTADAVHP